MTLFISDCNSQNVNDYFCRQFQGGTNHSISINLPEDILKTFQIFQQRYHRRRYLRDLVKIFSISIVKSFQATCFGFYITYVMESQFYASTTRISSPPSGREINVFCFQTLLVLTLSAGHPSTWLALPHHNKFKGYLAYFCYNFMEYDT